jgi:molecular chaperone GrpE
VILSATNGEEVKYFMTEKDKKHKEDMAKENLEKHAEDPAVDMKTTSVGPDQEAAETVTIPLKEYAAQLEELDDLRKKTDDFSNGWQRERADFSNYRKLVARDQDTEKQNSKLAILKRYLDIHDDLELAIKNMPDHVKSDPWTNGILLIYQKLSNLLNGEGLKTIPTENSAFDPALHEAISHEELEGFESGKIIDVVQKGYTIGDRVIRPARVRVAK